MRKQDSKPVTSYIKQHALPIKGNLYRTQSKFVMIEGNMYKVVPRFVALTITSGLSITAVIGPLGFMGHFEETPQGKYLIKMIAYPRLTSVVRNKVKAILTEYVPWIIINRKTLEVMTSWRTDNDWEELLCELAFQG